MIEDNVTQNVASARSRHRIEPLLSVSYIANSDSKIGALRIKRLPNYAYYICIINHLARSDPNFTQFQILSFLSFRQDLRKLFQEKTIKLSSGDRTVLWIWLFF